MTAGTRGRVACALLCALGTLGWLGGERDRAAEGNRLYKAERYDEAETAYGEGLVDYPESEELRFNLATAQYRQGKFNEAIATLEALLPEPAGEGSGSPAAKVSPLAARAAYDIGNARFRLGQSLEDKSPQDALALYEQALAAYKRSMALDSDATDPKFNHEFVARHVEELKKRLEKERAQQEQQEQQQEQAEGPREEQENDQQAEDQQERQSKEQRQQAGEDHEQSGKQDSQESPREQAGAGEQQDQGGEEGTAPESQVAAGTESQDEERAGEEREDFSKAEARTLIDAARGEEVDPSEIQHHLGIAGIGEAVEDW